jgi:hypothetical protein
VAAFGQGRPADFALRLLSIVDEALTDEARRFVKFDPGLSNLINEYMVGEKQ